jgi:hypothetical protein
MQLTRIAADKEIKRMEFDRLDAGIRRQLKALLKRITSIMMSGLETGTLSPEKWKVAYFTVRDRLMKDDMPAALNDALADAIYDALESIRSARWSARQVEADRKAEVVAAIEGGADPEDVYDDWTDGQKAAMRSVYATPCIALSKVWRLFGDTDAAGRLDNAVALAERHAPASTQ